MQKVLIIIPTYNERDNIEKLLPLIYDYSASILEEQGLELDVLVVDDNSPDKTAEVVQKIAKENPRVKLLSRPAKSGLGRAYIDGFKYALNHGYDFIFEMDADFSHDPGEIPSFIEAARENDVVIGSRYKNGISVVNWPLKRLILSLAANYYVRLVTGIKLYDSTTGYKCFHRRVLESINLDEIHSDGYSFQVEVNWRAHRAGFSIAEIPIIFVDRHSGSSKMSPNIIMEAIFMVWKLRLGL